MTNEENKDVKEVNTADPEAGAEAGKPEDAEVDSSEEKTEESTETGEKTSAGEPEENPETEEAGSDDAALNELNRKYMRLAADFQNFKRRTEKEKSDIYQYANEKIALDVIEVIDNFERALEHVEECADRNFAEGVEKIYKQLLGVLEKNSIEQIKAEGEAFDPNFHNAVMTKAEEAVESGIVINDMQKGYMLNGKVIRPSMVIVSQ